ncbi:hypothetical protein F511_01020, partial [Dorcoceras hygrometricum]
KGPLKPGLYLVGTPIGNLEDITLRALRVLKFANVILSEDTRHSGKLLHHYNIKTPLLSYHKFNESQREQVVLRRLQDGEIVALISDAGTPGISDPGMELAKLCVDKDIPVIPVPGPSAVIAALSASGLPTNEFTFVGFLSKHTGTRRDRMLVSANSAATQVFFVPPHKLCQFLEESSLIFGLSRQCVIAREITKLHEEFWRGTLEEAKEAFSAHQPKGEITLMIEGTTNRETRVLTEAQLENELGELISKGHSLSELGWFAIHSVFINWHRKLLNPRWKNMALFYSNASNEEDILATTYSPSQKLISYPSSGTPNNKAYASQPSVSESYLNMLSSSTILAHDHGDKNYIRSTGERAIIPPKGFPTDVQQLDTQLNFMCRFSDCDTVAVNPHAFTKELEHSNGPKQKSLSHGLCLSLGSQEHSPDQMTSHMNQYANSSLCSLLSSHVLQSEDHVSQRINLKNVEYLSFDLSGGNQDVVKYEVMNNFQNLISSKDAISFPFLHQTSEFSGTSCNSKYLKAAQDLLEEVVNVHRAFETSGKGKNKNLLGPDGLKETGATGGETSAEFRESTTNAPHLSLSPSERHNLQNKMTKLVSMLEEVDKRYKQYLHQMQALVSSFDMVAGRGVTKQYSALAQRTISSQFRSLRDAIKKQIQHTQNNLEEQDADSHGQGVLSRLRYVDQKLRQQKIVQQCGIMRQPWRPQRGLPETAVSVLRAWLFEHFLHPYPKDSEKSILARQTGLTRSQVANWFINARVRLWKPMIEDIYKEEFGDAETEPKSSPEHASVTQEVKGAEAGLQESLISAHSIQSRHSVFSSAELSYDAGVLQENEINYGLTRLHKQHVDEDSTHKDMILDGSIGSQVSLALDYTRNYRDSQPVLVENKLKGDYAEYSSMGLDKSEFYDENTINHQPRFVNPKQLSDFVL